MEGMPERGASGRLIIGPTHLSRADLVFNYDVVGQAIQWMGTRPGIEALHRLCSGFFSHESLQGQGPNHTPPGVNLHVDEKYMHVHNIT